MSVRSHLNISSWSSIAHTPRDLLRHYSLPQVVRIQDSSSHIHGPATLDLRRPLLLYKAYTCSKVHARSLERGENGEIKPIGPPVVFPDSYQGWFSVISDNGLTAGYFRSMEQVVQAKVLLFLTKDDVTGYKCPDSEATEKRTMYSKVVTKSGRVLRVLGLYEDLSYKTFTTVDQNSSDKNSRRFVKCLTQEGEVLFLPLNTPGIFYTIACRKSNSIGHVFLLSNLLKVWKLPLIVRLVSGQRPQFTVKSTGLFQLEEVQQKDVILACSVRNEDMFLFEIDLDSSFMFVQALNDLNYQKTDTYQRMLMFCAVEADKWRKQIKIEHSVFPQVQDSKRLFISSFRNKVKDKKHEEVNLDTGSNSLFWNFETLDSKQGSDSVKSRNSFTSKKSSASSRFTNPFSRLWNSWKTKKLHVVKEVDIDSNFDTASAANSNEGVSTMSYSAVDVNLYESLKGNIRRTFPANETLHLVKYLFHSSDVTSQVNEESYYDSFS
ncbi:uncharacterized protein LOC143235241 [Tachypleus tridentatus]|uniref:uncharacterized protein LOC143235241 n=1 Tax=Tachypleus tridentatus TaxID=6853 RepID=UPI003FD19DC1